MFGLWLFIICIKAEQPSFSSSGLSDILKINEATYNPNDRPVVDQNKPIDLSIGIHINSIEGE